MQEYEIYEVEYNKLVANFMEEAKQRHEVQQLGGGYGRTNRISGKSGYRHQIDVHIEYIYKEIRILQLIECKLKDKAGIGDVLTFHSRIIDIQAAKQEEGIIVYGTIVSPGGVTGGAQKYCEFYGIDVSTKQFGKRQGSFSTRFQTTMYVGVAGSA